MKRVVVISDLHCGHILGLTPPAWDSDRPKEPLKKAYMVRRVIWEFYRRTLKRLQPIDILVVNGDAIDGHNEGQGGTELLFADLKEQRDMAIDCIMQARADRVVMSYGTAYHTGKGQDEEREIAEKVSAVKIGSVDSLEVNGLIMNYRHFVGASQVPHTRGTAISRERLWNVLWAERGEYPLADIIIRSHVHYHTYTGASTWLAMTTPCLQGYGSKYGARLLSGLVDIGLLHFDISRKGEYTWQAHTLLLPRSEPIKL